MTYLTVSAKDGLNIERLFNLIARDINKNDIIPGRESVHSFAFDTHPPQPRGTTYGDCCQ